MKISIIPVCLIVVSLIIPKPAKAMWMRYTCRTTYTNTGQGTDYVASSVCFFDGFEGGGGYYHPSEGDVFDDVGGGGSVQIDLPVTQEENIFSRETVEDTIATLLQIKNKLLVVLSQAGLSDDAIKLVNNLIAQLDNATDKANIVLNVLNGTIQVGQHISNAEYAQAIAEVSGLVAGLAVGTVVTTGPILSIILSLAAATLVEESVEYTIDSLGETYNVIMYQVDNVEPFDPITLLCSYIMMRKGICDMKDNL